MIVESPRLVPSVIFVVPCFNEELVLQWTAASLLAELDSLCIDGLCSSHDSGILFVDDGSRDATWQLIRDLSCQDPRVKGLRLSRNKGHQAALVAGLEAAVDSAEITISIDADLQDDISVCSQMLSFYCRGCDVVYGVRGDRSADSRSKRFFANSFYSLMRFMDIEVVPGHADFRLMSRRALKELLCYKERSLFLRGLIPQLGFKSACVYYSRKTRTLGSSKYPFRKSLALALNGIISLSFQPLRLIAFMGVLMALFSLVSLVHVLVSFLSGQAIQGWTSLMVIVTALGGVQLLSIGVLGEYLGRVYTEVKRRPLYHVADLQGFALSTNNNSRIMQHR